MYIVIMKYIKCPKCETPVLINIAEACDEEGETFMCKKCKFIFRYTEFNYDDRTV